MRNETKGALSSPGRRKSSMGSLPFPLVPGLLGCRADSRACNIGRMEGVVHAWHVVWRASMPLSVSMRPCA